MVRPSALAVFRLITAIGTRTGREAAIAGPRGTDGSINSAT
jgi:hypothetical protein